MLVSVLNFLQSTMTVPTAYGWVHLLSICSVIALTTLLIRFFRNISEKHVRLLLLTMWLLMVVSELYKQIVFTFSVNEVGEIVRNFQWYAFPFQFCSTPLYTIPFVVFLPEGKVRDCFIAFLCTFSLFGGVAVYCFPGDVFISMIGINVQTMLHHGLQITIGAYFATRYYKKLHLRFFLGGVAVFACLVTVAMALNLGVHQYLVSTLQEEVFNMFFISPYHECTLPVLSLVWPLVPYGVFLLIYVFGFALVALLVFGIEVGLTKLFKGKRNGIKA